MKKILLASAAAAALLFMPLAASAQYAPASPAANAPYAVTSPSTTDTATTDTAVADPGVTTTTTTEMAPAAPTDVTPAVPTTTTATTTTADQSVAQTTTPALTPAQVEAQQNARAIAPSYDTTTTAPSYGATAQAASPAPQVASNTSQVRGELISDTKALELAQDAGMEAAPTSAAGVCQPRALDLSGGATHDNRNKLEFAVDRASVCELQAVEIPARGAAGFRQTLIAQGVDESKITVADDGANEVQMTFAGVATSGGMYAALYNPVRSAENTVGAGAQDMSYAPQASSTPSYSAPTSTSATPSSPDAAQAPVTDEDLDTAKPAETTSAAPTL